MFLFIILLNSAGFAKESREIGEKVTQAHNAHKVIKSMHAKYVDDLTIAEAFKMKDVVDVENEDELRRPLNFHQRTEYVMNENSSQVSDMLHKIEEHANTNGMVINRKKTKVMSFNTSIKYDFLTFPPIRSNSR